MNLKTANLQDPIFTTIGDHFEIKITRILLYVPVYIPDPATQAMFEESTKISFRLIFDSWTTVRTTVIAGLDYQLNIGSSSNIKSPKN